MDKNISISYAVTASTEHLELESLLSLLTDSAREIDEIVVQIDSNSATQEIRDISSPSVKFIEFPLNNHFGNFKNNLKSNCSKDYIFQIDADELPSEDLLKVLPEILSTHPDPGLFHVPRVNTVEGITQAHIEKWKWSQNQFGWINWPDWQPRIFKNLPTIKWELPVHETIVNYGSAVFLPAEEGYSLRHPKTIIKQESQNDFYSTLSPT